MMVRADGRPPHDHLQQAEVVEVSAVGVADWEIGVERFEIPLNEGQLRSHVDQERPDGHLDAPRRQA